MLANLELSSEIHAGNKSGYNTKTYSSNLFEITYIYTLKNASALYTLNNSNSRRYTYNES